MMCSYLKALTYSCLVLPRRVVFSFWEVTFAQVSKDSEQSCGKIDKRRGENRKSDVRLYQHQQKCYSDRDNCMKNMLGHHASFRLPSKETCKGALFKGKGRTRQGRKNKQQNEGFNVQ